MAIIKCKMCGGDLDLVKGSTVAECEYCGTTQTVPSADNEKKLTLFGRAGRLLRGCEFDKAAGVFETIVADFPEEAEAYWGLVLCKYGIEYVDDPATGKKIPTCHRSSFDSIFDDENFEQAQENADAVARRVYREEAKAIEDIRKGIIEVSGKEEPYDIFICYKETAEDGDRTLDSVLAQDIYDALTEKGYRVFFSRVTLEDKLGQEYEPYIFAALNSAKIMLAVGTAYDYYNAVWVKNEWSRFLKLIASGEKKTLIPCFKDLDPYDMPKEFARLQSQHLGKVGAMQDLLRGIEKILPRKKEASQQTVVVQSGSGATAGSLLRRGQLFLEDEEWNSAKEYFNKVLDIDPENADAYLGFLMADLKVKKPDDLPKQNKLLRDQVNYQKAVRFAVEAKSNRLEAMASEQEARLKKEEEERREAEDRRRREQREADRKRSIAEQEKKQANMERLKSIRERLVPVQSMIAAGSAHTVGLRTDGTVVAAGSNNSGELAVSGWRNIVAIAAGSAHTVGLRTDGTVVATRYIGEYYSGQCEVSGWTNIVAIAAGDRHTVGLRADGTVVAAWPDDSVKLAVSGWRNIVAIAAGGKHTVGLHADGTVVAVSEKGVYYGQCEVTRWTDIVEIAAGSNFTVGLRTDGMVVGTKYTGNLLSLEYGQSALASWRNIVAVAAGSFYAVGLLSDGTVLTTSKNEYGEGNVSGWKLFGSPDTIEQERAEAKTRAEAKRRARITALYEEKADLQKELATLRGLFTGKRRKEIEARLAAIEAELKKR